MSLNSNKIVTKMAIRKLAFLVTVISALKMQFGFERRWLEYGKVMKGMALLFAGLVALLVGFWFTVAPDDKQPVAWMVALFGLLDLPLLIEFFGVRIGFDDEQIYCHSGWRKNRVIPWRNLKSCT